MKRALFFYGTVFLLATVFLRQTSGSDWRFPVGLSYVHGFNDVVDFYESSVDADIFAIPVGVTFHPYYNFDFGLRLGMGVGPLSVVYIQYIGYGEDKFFLNIPLNINIGYTILPGFNVSPYLRTGLVYHAATGDYLESSKPGFFGAIGLEFLRKKRVGFGFEIAIDKAEMEFDEQYYSWGSYYSAGKTTLNPGKVLISVFAIF